MASEDDTSTNPGLGPTEPDETISAEDDQPAAAAATLARIGPYRLTRQIGEGGMGQVFEAIQERPLVRRVALKLIKVGMDTERVIARFESERQTLARMSHSGIAVVLDAGSTDRGRPYFVMEYVEGAPLTTYCDQHRLGVGERLALFVRICDGVQHAHQRGVIHRDLKPSNVLVHEQDGEIHPKIIDFGIARATARDGDEDGLTRAGEFIGTPAYMSPEQTEGSLDLDTRTDVYSLGVMLYELLVGALPVDPAELHGRGVDGLLKAVREQIPSRPSQRLTQAGERQESTVAVLRRTDPQGLRRELRGDLDWIVLKAIEKDRGRRYASVSELAADIGRHLRHEPVLAGPPSKAYRARKFVRRHRVAVAAAALVTLSLIAGVIGTTTGMVRARRAERTARIEAQTSTRVSDFLVEIFDLADPGEARGNTVTAREILDKGVDKIRSELVDEPETRSRLLETMGRVYRSLGLYRESRPLLEEAVAVRGEIPEADPVTTAKVLITLAGLLQKMGNSDEALAAAEQARILCEQAGPAGRAELGRAWNNIGAAHFAAKRFDQAREAWSLALAINEQEFGLDSPEVGKILGNLATLERRAKNFPAAIAHAERAIAIASAEHGEIDPEVAAFLTNLAITYKQAGDLGQAHSTLVRVLGIHARLYQGDHADVASARNALADVCFEAGDLACAIENAEIALAMRERIFGPTHETTVRSVRTLRDAYRKAGRHTDADAMAARSEPDPEAAVTTGR